MAFDISVLKLPTIKNGSRGLHVRAWQSFLTEADYPVGTIDGDFGDKTEVATRNYQQRNELTVNGVVNIATYAVALRGGFIYKVPNLTAKLLLEYLRFGEAEVRDLQKSLNTIITPDLEVDGDFGLRSSAGLAQAYKQRDVRLRRDLENKLSTLTKQKLGDDFLPAIDILNGYAKRIRFRLSGSHWIEYFPTSRSISDLAPPFRENVQAFYNALVDAGSQIIIAATYRPPQRAYLMHYAAKIDRGQIVPARVPSMAGVDIEWVHYTNAGSLQAAEQMVEAYGLGGNPVALKSLHTQRLAIDWNITWDGTLKIKKKDGVLVSIGDPPNGAFNVLLHAVGASYGVLKLWSDPPHWSINGR
ncbi:MAG: peptidoglycan-binding protein [Coleofasciculus sp. S288]|nr:peptidoglycan-binding protein [Coleofasciculus sp. S288]